MSDAERLERLEDIARRLWPYVRFFGLCGADPGAVQAVADLGRFLGFTDAQAAGEAIGKSQQETLDALVAWLEAHRFYGRLMNRQNWETLMRELKATHPETVNYGPQAEAAGS